MSEHKIILTKEEYDKPLPFSVVLDVLKSAVALCESYIEDKPSAKIRTDGSSLLLMVIVSFIVTINIGYQNDEETKGLLLHIIDGAEEIYNKYLKH